MGLTGFNLKERATSKTRSIAEWSSEHFESTGRPLRIAIDQANWWFRNINVELEIKIKHDCPGSHPREKRIMERIFYLLRMNVQLIFVFDGPNKPSKHRPGGPSPRQSAIALLKQLLDQLGVPRHDAPGEAEAECARLQSFGIVDAVWSDDSDSFMFGCTTLVQFHKPEGSEFKSEDSVLLYTADSLVNRSKLTREGLLMYAIVVGCDYANGFRDIGTIKFLELAKHHKFQETANLLAAASSNPRELSRWRAMLFRIYKDTFPKNNFTIPPDTFPDLEVLKHCARPNVSPDSKLRSLVSCWFRPFGPGMTERYRFLVRHFHSRKSITWPADYLVPIELNHRLRERPRREYANGLTYHITEKTVMGPKKDTTITVNPLLVIPELDDAFPPEWYDRDTGLPPKFNDVKVTLLDCVVRRGLPGLAEKTKRGRSRGKTKKGTPSNDTTGRRVPDSRRAKKPSVESGSPGRVHNQSKVPRKRTSSSLDGHNRSGPDKNKEPERRIATPAEPPHTTAHSRGILDKTPVAVIDNENEVANEAQMPAAHKRQKLDVSSLTNIAVIDLT
ncbi:PIN domain-like protein [Hypoxylon sp. NC1633]|nr:PIN domain-like protein [Hypoxylon sp. NC1633]